MSIAAQGTTFEISDDLGVTWTDLGCVTSWTNDRPDRAEIDTTCLTSTAKEFMFGLRDNGTVSIETMYAPSGAGQVIAEASYNSNTAYDFRTEYTDTLGANGTIKEFKGFVIGMSESGGVDDIVNLSMNIKVSGDITVTPAA